MKMRGWKCECPFHQDHYLQVHIWGQLKWRSSIAIGKILLVSVSSSVTFLLGLNFFNFGLWGLGLLLALVIGFNIGNQGLFLDLTVDHSGILTVLRGMVLLVAFEAELLFHVLLLFFLS